MSILASQIVIRPAVVATDSTTSNVGGVMDSSRVITSNVSQNLLPNITEQQRVTGTTTYRKFFVHVNTTDTNPLIGADVYMTGLPTGTDWVALKGGTQTDTLSNITSGTEPLVFGFRVGQNLYVDTLSTQTSTYIREFTKLYTAGDVTLHLFFAGGNPDENDCGAYVSTNLNSALAAGRKIYITDGVNIESSTITSVSGLSLGSFFSLDGNGSSLHSTDGFAGVAFSVTLATPFQNSYASGSFVSSCISVNSLAATVTNISNSNILSSVFALNNSGCIYDNWTITDTSSTTYNVTGALTGLVGTSAFDADFAPINPKTNSPYFTIVANGLNPVITDGIYSAREIQSGTFTTNPAAIPLWAIRTIPANCDAITNDGFTVTVSGQSA